MRTTIDLRPDLHERASWMARDGHRSLSDVVNDLLARVLDPPPSPTFSVDPDTGLPLVKLGKTITVEDVRSLDDD